MTKNVLYLGDAVSIHVQRWANYFAERGWKVDIVTYSPCDESKLYPTITQHKVFHIPKLEGFVEPANCTIRVYEIRNLIKKLKPDIIHAHNLPKWGVYAGLIDFNPFILTNWGISDLTYIQSPIKRRKMNKTTWKSRKSAFEKADVITTLVFHAKNMIVKNFGVDPNKIKTFQWGVDTTIFKPNYKKETDELRKRLKIDDSSFVVISTRNMDPYYGIKYIISAAQKVIKKHPETVFIFLRAAGNFKFENKMKKFAKQMKIAKNIRFVSELVPYNEMPIYLNLSDISIMIPFTDQGPLSLIEAMACGTIPIATNIEGNREWINDGINGFLAPPNDLEIIAKNINNCIENRELKNKFYMNNKNLVEQRGNWKNATKMMEEIYIELINHYK